MTESIISTRPLTRADLHPDKSASLTTQEYGRKARIDGVRLESVGRFTEDGGSFSELLRLSEGKIALFPGFEVLQVNYSDMEPGVVKAWHVHFQQEDVWFVPPINKILVGLYDLRKDSPTCGETMRFVMGEGQAQLLLIPRGVAHGATNLSGSRQILMYFVNNQFNAENPDEQRLDPFILGREFWALNHG